MGKRTRPVGNRPRRIAAAAVCALVPLLAALPAHPQSATTPDAPAAQPVHRPGLFEAVGRWFDQAGANFRQHLRGAKQRMDDLGDEAAANSRQLSNRAAEVGKGAAEVGRSAAEATKNAVDAVTKLPTARMVEGRERCGIAPNGAPDCVAAAEALCRRNGYSTGKSMDFTSAEQCPPKVLLGQASADQCETVTFISRAMCQ